MPEIRKEYPRLKILWIEEKTSSLLSSLHEGTLDAALLALETNIGKLERFVIATDPFVLATPRNHPLGMKRAAASPGELRDVGVLHLDDGHCFRDQALAFCTESQAHEMEFRATSLSTLAQMVASGSGVTLLPGLSVATESRRSDLQIRGFTKPSPYRTIGLVWRKGSPLTATIQRVAETIRRVYPH